MIPTWTISGNLTDYAKWKEDQAARIATLEADCAVLRKALLAVHHKMRIEQEITYGPNGRVSIVLNPGEQHELATALASTTAGKELLHDYRALKVRGQEVQIDEVYELRAMADRLAEALKNTMPPNCSCGSCQHGRDVLQEYGALSTPRVQAEGVNGEARSE